MSHKRPVKSFKKKIIIISISNNLCNLNCLEVPKTINLKNILMNKNAYWIVNTSQIVAITWERHNSLKFVILPYLGLFHDELVIQIVKLKLYVTIIYH